MDDATHVRVSKSGNRGYSNPLPLYAKSLPPSVTSNKLQLCVAAAGATHTVIGASSFSTFSHRYRFTGRTTLIADKFLAWCMRRQKGRRKTKGSGTDNIAVPARFFTPRFDPLELCIELRLAIAIKADVINNKNKSENIKDSLSFACMQFVVTFW